MPKVSVIIPTYNRADTLKDTIQSVLEQTYKDYEIIIIDDGSTDNTKNVVDFFLQIDQKIKYIFQENYGYPGYSRNKGIKIATGDFIAFLDDDDIWLKDKLSIQVPILEMNNDVGIVHGEAILFNSHGTIRETKHFKSLPLRTDYTSLFMGNHVLCLTALVRRECINKVGLFDSNLSHSQDYELWLRISRFWKILKLNEVLAMYRVHEDNRSRQENQRLICNLHAVNNFLTIYPETKKTIGIKNIYFRYFTIYQDLAYYYRSEENWIKAFKWAIKIFHIKDLNFFLKGLIETSKTIIRMIFKLLRN